MSTQSLQLSFGLIRITVWELMSFEDFQDGRDGTIVALLNLQCLLPSFRSNWLTVWEEMLFELFQDGRNGVARCKLAISSI